MNCLRDLSDLLMQKGRMGFTYRVRLVFFVIQSRLFRFASKFIPSKLTPLLLDFSPLVTRNGLCSLFPVKVPFYCGQDPNFRAKSKLSNASVEQSKHSYVL